MHPAVKRRRLRSSTLLLSIFLLLAGVLLGGCVRVKAAMAISDDDHVSGHIVSGTLTGGQDAVLNVPPELRASATSQPYKQDGYVGSTLDFNDLTFDELRTLMAASPVAAQHYQFDLHRSGDVLTLSATIDLTSLPATNADLGVKINFPGKVTASNGTEDADGTITWLPEPGKVNQLSATVITSSGTMSPLVRWWLVIGGLAGAVALVVFTLALVARRRFLRTASS